MRRPGTAALRAAQPQKPVVLSWLAQAEWQPDLRSRGAFEVLVRHLFERLLSSVSLGDEEGVAASWIVQSAYAAALPLLLYALYLFPAYHQPAGKPDFWTQTSHHFFYVDCSFAIMGLVTVLQWDLLFPDRLDALILTHLPIRRARLLVARVAALALLLGGMLLGTASLGILFFPAVADLPGIGLAHFAVHAAAVLTAGLCAICSVIALQGVVVCCLPQRLAQALSPWLQAGCVLVFVTLLLQEPLLAHLLPTLLTHGGLTPSGVAPHVSIPFWFPPFWFLGLYERLLHGAAVAAPFAALAQTGLLATMSAAALASVTYPMAYTRKIRQAIEGTITTRGPLPGAWLFAAPLRHTPLRDPRARAIAGWVSQTLWRLERTRLLLALFAAFTLAAPLAAWLLHATLHAPHHPALPGAPGPLAEAAATSANAALLATLTRFAIPAAALFTVAGLRTALRAPVGLRGAWAFRVVCGHPRSVHRRGARLWVASAASLLCILVACLVPATATNPLWTRTTQAVLGILLSVLLTDLFFLSETAFPFTARRAPSVNDLSFTAVTYGVLFPVTSLLLLAGETWFAGSAAHVLLASAAVAALHTALLSFNRRRHPDGCEDAHMDEDALLPGEIGLRR